MKFYCEACNTKYSIPDEKIQGKVLKVRCKSCGNIITVREQLSPVSATDSEPTTAQPNPLSPPPPPSAEPKVPTTNWYYSINGQSAGPFDLKTLRARYESGSIGDESYVWHESIVEWKPVSSVAAFQDALTKGQRLKPRAKTLGFTGPLEAIKVDQADKAPVGKQEGAVPVVEKAQEPAPRQDRLDMLREKLRNDAPSNPVSPQKPKAEPVQPTVEKPKFEQLKVEPKVDKPKFEQPKAEPKVDKPKFEQPKFEQPKFEQPKFEQPKFEAKAEIPKFEQPKVEAADTAKITFAPTVPDSKPKSESELKPFSADMFSPAATEDVADELEDWATSPPESPADSGLIPFFPESPKLSSTMAAPPTTSGSLLIQLDSIRKEGRKKRVAWIGGGVAVLVLAIFVGGYIASTYEPSKETVVLAKKDSRPAPVEKTYSREQLSSLGIELGEEVIEAGEKAQEEVPVAKVEEPEPKVDPQVEKGSDLKPKVDRPVVAKVNPEPKKEPTKVEPNVGGAVSAQSVLNYSNPTAASRNSGPTINRPEDSLTAQAALPSTLSKDSARDGFRVIRNSVMLCRERHMRRGATLDAKKIHISVTVEPNGTVSQYGVEPASIANTEFDMCMKSHMDRWRFAKWQGIATEINSSFVLQ